MNNRDILALDTQFQAYVYNFQFACQAQGLPILIYCTRRSFEDQDQLYALGRTAKGHIVTNAKAGQSAHNYGLAFDGAPCIGGKPLFAEPLDGPHWQKYGSIGKSCGMEWGGDFKSFAEGPHFQMPNWKQVAGQSNPT